MTGCASWWTDTAGFSTETRSAADSALFTPSKLPIRRRRAWLDRTHTSYRGATLEEAIKNNVLDQLDHLKQIPCVAQAVQARGLNLEGMYFHIHTGRMERYNAVSAQWEFISTEEK